MTTRRQALMWFLASWISLLLMGQALTSDRAEAVAALAACLFGASVVGWVASLRGRELPPEADHVVLALIGSGMALAIWLDRSYDGLGMVTFLGLAFGVGAQVPAYLLRRSQSGHDMRSGNSPAAPEATHPGEPHPRF